MDQQKGRFRLNKVLVLQEDSRKERSLVESYLSSEGLLIAISPFLLYILVFIRYSEFLRQFEIPISFIEFNLLDSIQILVSSFIFFIVGFILVWLILPRKSRVINSLWNLLLFLYLIISMFVSTKTGDSEYIYVLIEFVKIIFFIFIFLTVLFLIGTIVTKAKGNKIRLMFEVYKDLFSEIIGGLETIGDALGNKKYITFFIIYLLMLFVAINLGKYDANRKKEFYIASIKPECVVLYQSSQRIICANFNRAKKEVLTSYKVIYFQDNQDINFTLERVGPLHLKPTPTPTLKPTLTPTVTNTPLPTKTPTEAPPVQTVDPQT